MSGCAARGNAGNGVSATGGSSVRLDGGGSATGNALSGVIAQASLASLRSPVIRPCQHANPLSLLYIVLTEISCIILQVIWQRICTLSYVRVSKI